MSNESYVSSTVYSLGHRLDREFVTSAKKISRILTNFPKLKKFVKIRKKNSFNARVGVAFQQQLKNMMRFTVSC